MHLIVFTDIDGTLIDHETYSFEAAKPALAALKARGAHVVLASSKTAAEIEVLRRDMGVESSPAIVENGAGVLPPDVETARSVSVYDDLLKRLNALPADLRRHYSSFSQWDDEEVSRRTGLPKEGARLAKQRQYTEPGVWSGSDQDLDLFLKTLSQQGVTARRGGRFLTLSLGGTKAERMSDALALCDLDRDKTIVVALGDAPNDAEMLAAADYAIVIPNPGGKPVTIPDVDPAPAVRRANEAAPVGWNIEILKLLDELDRAERLAAVAENRG